MEKKGQSDGWQTLDQQAPANPPARAVAEAMKQLDLTPLFKLYFGYGSSP